MTFKKLAYQRKNIPLLLWLSLVIFYACSTTQKISLPFVPPENFDASTYLNSKNYSDQSGDSSFVLFSVKGGMRSILRHMKYPPETRRKGIHGIVILKVYIDSTGTLTNMVVDTSPDSSLSNAAKRATMQGRFNPSTLNGKPVNSYGFLPFKFSFFHKTN